MSPVAPLSLVRTDAAPAPDTPAAIAFLKLFAPRGPWCLTAIQTDRKAVSTETFWPTDQSLKDCAKWLREFNGKRNVYFHVNTVLKPLKKKAEREDIASVDWLHVDIDPRAGEDLDAERDRIRRLFNEELPDGVPPPSVVIQSGGGWQLFWKLAQSIAIDGDLAKAEEAKRYNQQIEFLFGGDNCHNIDRIMRLPGTINIPDEKKIKKGRVRALATLAHFDAKQVYPLAMFQPMQKGPSANAEEGAPTDVARIAGIEALDQWSVPDRVKIIIAQGNHPDEQKKGDNSRSAWVFDVCCNLVRCEVPDEVIFSVLTDPDFGISSSVLEKGQAGRRYALRQIERAKEHAIDPEFEKLNRRYGVIANYGNRCRVVGEDGEHLEFISFDDFRNRYMHRSVTVGTDKNGKPITVPLGKFWLGHSRRRQFERAEFAPGVELRSDVFNLWRKFPYAPRAGNCDAFLGLIRDVIGSGDEAIYGYLLDWMAHAIQHPEQPGEVAIVLKGGQGVGKSFFAEHFGQLFGRHFVPLTDQHHLTGNFNALLHQALLVFADEAYAAKDKRSEGVLKGLVTQSHLTIEPKGVDPFKVKKFLRLIMASNNQWVVPADADDRRYLVLDVARHRANDGSYFAAVEKEWASGGREALMAMLQARDITKFDHRRRPETTALADQKAQSLRGATRVVHEMLASGEAPHIKVEGRSVFVPTMLLHERSHARCTLTALGRELARAAEGGSTRECDPNGRQHRGFWLPPLSVARMRWAECLGFPVVWPEDDGEWPGVQMTEVM